MTRGRGRPWPLPLVALLVLSSCTELRPEGHAIVVAMANSAVNLDPCVGIDEASQQVHQIVFSSLVRLDRELRIVRDLAESIELRDPTTYVARLRPRTCIASPSRARRDRDET